MDNISHALAGLLLAEAVVQVRSLRKGAPPPSWRTSAYVISVAGNNLPDLDFLVSDVTGRPLGYLLHHRGHTHTVLAALVFAALMLAVLRWFAARVKVAWSRDDWRWLAGLSILGPLVHIAMDFSNNYGVHPWWPIYDGWSYGDAVFIIEPFFWAIGIPPLLFAARARATKVVLAAILVAGIGAAWLVSFVPATLALSLTLVATFVGLAARIARPAVRIGIGVIGSWLVAATFFAASSVAKSTVRHSEVSRDGDILEVVATPFPANPFCHAVLVVQTRGTDYVVRRATIATFPSLISSGRCPSDPDEEPTAPFTTNRLTNTAAIRWRGEFVAPMRELAALWRDNCQIAAFLRWARVPYWIRDNTDEYIVGDLRYDRRPGLDFSDFRIANPPPRCPRGVPPWLPPRGALLERRDESPASYNGFR